MDKEIRRLNEKNYELIKAKYGLSKEGQTMKEFNLALYELGFNPGKKAFYPGHLKDFQDSEFDDLEQWYLDKINKHITFLKEKKNEND